MYFFYTDESGNSDPRIQHPNGTMLDHIYVLLAVSLFEHRWHQFEGQINQTKLSLLEDVTSATGLRLDLANAEVHSNVIRIPNERQQNQFFKFLTRGQLTSLVDLFYNQLDRHHMHLFAVVIDKRKLAAYMDAEKLKRKAYELLLERIQNFLQEYHPKHQGLIVADDMGIGPNRSLAMKHSFFQRCPTTAGLELRHIVEMPFFVRSELSNGVQLADLCAYNVYRAFKTADLSYEYFRRICRQFYSSRLTQADKLDGLKVFPPESELVHLLACLGKELAAG